MADKTFQTKTYTKDGGDTFVIGPGGSMENQDFGTVTQATNPTTGVTLDTLAGQITTVAGTLAAAGEESFTVTNARVAATDTVVACIGASAGAGLPAVAVTAVAAGSFQLTVTNLHASAALNAVVVIHFYVLKANA